MGRPNLRCAGRVLLTTVLTLSAACRAGDATGLVPAQDPDFPASFPAPPSALSIVGTLDDSAVAAVLPPGLLRATIVDQPFVGTAEVRNDTIWYHPAGLGIDQFVLDARSPIGIVRSLLVKVEIRRPATRFWSGAIRPQTSDRTVFRGIAPDDPRLKPLRPLVRDILRAYGSPSQPLGQVRAIRDWVARTAIHPYYWLHTSDDSANRTVLPPNVTWWDLNDYVEQNTIKANVTDNDYWEQFSGDGLAMLDSLLGTLDPATGTRADNGIMRRVQGAQYQMRSLESYRFMQCSSQDRILVLLWAAAGYNGMLISTIGHDPAAVFIPRYGWVYEDPTFNEEFTLRDSHDPLSPLDLLSFSRANRIGALTSRKLLGPSWSRDTYVGNELGISDSYFHEHPTGMLLLGSQVNSRFIAPLSGNRLVQISVAGLDSNEVFGDADVYTRVTPTIAFPPLGAYVSTQVVTDGHVHVELGSSYPGTVGYERRIGNGAWQRVSSSDDIPVVHAAVEYRPVTARDMHGASASITASDLESLEVPPRCRYQQTVCADESTGLPVKQ